MEFPDRVDMLTRRRPRDILVGGPQPSGAIEEPHFAAGAPPDPPIDWDTR